jgi:hypothetical protein
MLNKIESQKGLESKHPFKHILLTQHTKMDCSICMEAITKATGSAVLSCEHAFHFRCIDSWFTKQIWDDLAQTCPCCRNSGCDMDRCSVQEFEGGEDDEADEDDDEDDESYADAESQAATDMPNEEELEDIRWERLGPGRWMIVNSQELAMECFRSLFGPLNELDAVEENPQNVAAVKIQTVFRGHRVRNTHTAVMALLRLLAVTS